MWEHKGTRVVQNNFENYTKCEKLGYLILRFIIQVQSLKAMIRMDR